MIYVCFYIGLLTRQKVLDGIPSTNQLYLFLLENSILDKKNIGKNSGCFSEEDDRSLVNLILFFKYGTVYMRSRVLLIKHIIYRSTRENRLKQLKKAHITLGL